MEEEQETTAEAAEPLPTRFGRERSPAPKPSGRLTGAGAPPEPEAGWLGEREDGDGL